MVWQYAILGFIIGRMLANCVIVLGKMFRGEEVPRKLQVEMVLEAIILMVLATWVGG